MNNLFIKRIYILTIMLWAFGSCILAQTMHSLYFMDGNNMRNELNPAFTSEKAYFTFPVMGNINISANSNIGLGAIMTPRGNNEMITFMHPDISADEALSKFKGTNIVEAGVDENIMSVGFNAFKGTNTIGISLR